MYALEDPFEVSCFIYLVLKKCRKMLNLNGADSIPLGIPISSWKTKLPIGSEEYITKLLLSFYNLNIIVTILSTYTVKHRHCWQNVLWRWYFSGVSTPWPRLPNYSNRAGSPVNRSHKAFMKILLPVYKIIYFFAFCIFIYRKQLSLSYSRHNDSNQCYWLVWMN